MTSPSAEEAAKALRQRGYDVVVGTLADGKSCEINEDPKGNQLGIKVYFPPPDWAGDQGVRLGNTKFPAFLTADELADRIVQELET